jgi:hypothetical protein
MQTSSRFRLLPVSVLAAVALTAILVLSACGSAAQPASSTSPSGTQAALLDSSQGGFTIKYPASFVKIEPSASPGADPSLVYQVFLADPTGAKSGDAALDGLSVTVRRMSKTAKPGDVRRYKSQFEAMAAELIGRPDELKRSAPFALVPFGGQTALRTTYLYKVNGTAVAAVAYLVPVGKRVYWVTGQASQGTWSTSGRGIGASLATFSLKP